jgi:GTP-binding protein
MADSNFIDYVKIHCKSGAGGAGSAHFFRAKGLPNGGPDGGDGGNGGDVVLQANAQLWTLLHLKYTKHVKAGPGKPGGINRMHGARGEDLILEVPVGTVARDAETGEIITEVLKEGERYVLLPGGRGGLGNDHFKSPTNQAPEYAQPGETFRENWIVLELKVLADVGLVGLPNAGKSTLLSSVSAARPAIADYPFTTITPNLGVVSYRDFQSFVMADIPGIIEGAHQGRGLGLRFLRHIERNPLLLFLVPVTSEDIEAEYQLLLTELENHNPELLEKKRILGISKMDLADDDTAKKLKALKLDIPVVPFSAATSSGLTELKDNIWKFLSEKSS